MKKSIIPLAAIFLSACSIPPEFRSYRGSIPTGREAVATKVEQKAREHRVPVALAKAVTHVESRFRCNAVGPSTRYGRAAGPLQIMPSSARSMFGFSGPASALASCDLGLEYGMRHLALCYARAGQDLRAAAHCHVQGPHRDPHRPVNAYARSYGRWVMALLDGPENAGKPPSDGAWAVLVSDRVAMAFQNP